MTKRRELLRALGAGVLIGGAWSARGQQQTRIPRVGVLWFGTRQNASMALFRQRLRELGYVEGTTILIEERQADLNPQRLNDLARDLVDSRVDVIVAPGLAATTAARQATSTTPIVMVHAGDPIGAGLIASLARPGGNVTGTTNMELGAKHVELIRELVPRIAKLAVLANPTNAAVASSLGQIADAARSFNVGMVLVEVTRAEDFPSAFTTLRNARPDGLLVVGDPVTVSNAHQIIDFAASARLPALYDGMAKVGGLISYAPIFLEHYAIAAVYVDKILKGAKPAALPVEQPAKFQMVIDMKAAKALNLTIPQSLLLRADEVIR